MKYSLCLETVFENIDFYDRIPLAKELGLDAVEFWEPEKFDAKKIGKIAGQSGIPVVACCVYDTRNTTFNSEYGKIEKSLLKTIEIGKEFGCTSFIGLAGDVECKADSQKSILIENLKRAAELCEKNGVTLLLEALNSICDHKGYYLDSSYIGFEIIRAVNSPNVKLLYDMYHMQLMEGNLINNATKNINLIGHLHSAGVPGRHELQLGEVDYPRIIEAVEKTGYDGYFGFEYFPTYESEQSVKDVLSYVKGM
jgi:hydroxypyruvate isomerase